MAKAEYIAIRLKQRIEAGGWSIGEKLPSESSLCEEYVASRITIRSAFIILVAYGYAATYKGKGTFVQRPEGSERPCGL